MKYLSEQKIDIRYPAFIKQRSCLQITIFAHDRRVRKQRAVNSSYAIPFPCFDSHENPVLMLDKAVETQGISWLAIADETTR